MERAYFDHSYSQCPVPDLVPIPRLIPLTQSCTTKVTKTGKVRQDIDKITEDNELCRLCLDYTSGLFEIFGNAGQEENIPEKILRLFNIQVSKDDGWPQSICMKCHGRLLELHEFSFTVKHTDAALPMLFGEKIKNDNPEKVLEFLDEAFTPNDEDFFVEDDEWESTDEMEEDKKEEWESSDDDKRFVTKSHATQLRERSDEKIAKFFQLSCGKCFKVFKKLELLFTHYQDVHNEKGYVICCDKRFMKREKVQEHLNFHEHPEQYTCNQCGIIFMAKANLRVHKVNHHMPVTERKFKCDKCPKRFINHHKLSIHQISHVPRDERDRQHACEQCNKKFVHIHDLRKHISEVHEKNHRFMCEICAHVFYQKHNFKMHQQTHMQQERFECAHCEKTYKTRDLMARHMQQHIKTNEVFDCDVCGRNMGNRTSLNMHKKYVHSTLSFTCIICDKVFNRKSSLKQHMHDHTGFRHKCKFCSKTFKHISSKLSHHRKDHPDEWAIAKQNKY